MNADINAVLITKETAFVELAQMMFIVIHIKYVIWILEFVRQIFQLVTIVIYILHAFAVQQLRIILQMFANYMIVNNFVTKEISPKDNVLRNVGTMGIITVYVERVICIVRNIRIALI